MGKDLSYLQKWGVGVNYCWNYGPSKLLLHLVEYRVNQLNSKHTKIAVNSAIQYFEGYCQKKCLLKVWSFLIHPPQNGGPVKFLRNWTEIMKMHNMCKIWFANKIFSLLRWNKKYISWFFKGFQLPEIVLRL